MGGLMQTYSRLPVTFSHGDGVWLVDDDGKRYLDAISGIGVNALGHGHPALTKAIQEQAGQLIHTSNLYGVEKQQALADALTAASDTDAVFFCNSGAEANEAAIKLARLHGRKKGLKSPHIVVFDNAFHGRTMATLTASGSRKIQAGFEPLLSGFTRAPYGDLAALQQIADSNSQIAAVLIEPIQGEGGVNVPPADYLQAVSELCKANDWLLMLDEVQTGNGRTGAYFADGLFRLNADVITTAKGLGGGVPIGACLARGDAAQLFQPGNHGSTFGGNPLACAAALAVVNTIVDEDLSKAAADKGQLLQNQLADKLKGVNGVREIRGHGLMCGIELDTDCGELVADCREKGLLINVTAGSVVRLLPPLTISNDELGTLTDILCDAIKAFTAKLHPANQQGSAA